FCSISRYLPRWLSILRLCVALGDHPQHCLADHLLAHLAEFFFESIQRDHGLSHGPMAAGAADVVVEFLHDLAGTFDVADVTHGNDDPVFDQAGDDSPFNALDLQTKPRHLRNNVFAIDLAHVNHGDADVQLNPGQSPPEDLEILAGKPGTFN